MIVRSVSFNFEGSWTAGVMPNITFLFQIRDLIFSYFFGNAKNLKVIFEQDQKPRKHTIDMSKEMDEYLSFLVNFVDQPLQTVENTIGLDRGHLKSLLKDQDSYLLIKQHLVIQTLLWCYIKIKIGRLPRQYENWSFLQILDLAEAFNEIPQGIIGYFSALNSLRNNIAHKPAGLVFKNIKSKYSGALYVKEGPLFGISTRPETVEENFKDWKTTFLVSVLVLGFLIRHEGL